MSYDLMVFETTTAPQTKKDFLAWFDEQVAWEEDHDYQTISVASSRLQDWYGEMKQTFPPMNGDDAPDDEWFDEHSEAYLTDYSIGQDMIYAAFAWSVAEEAHQLMRSLAKKHGVGFFDVSRDNGGAIILPDGTKLK